MNNRFKNIKSKKQVLESWTPVLSGDYISSPNASCGGPFQSPTDFTYNDCQDMYDKPAWLDPDEDSPGNNGGSRLSIGAYYINGVPLSNWSTRMGGSAVSAYRHSSMQNWYTTKTLFKKYFPNGLGVNKVDTFDKLEIKKLNIIKLIPSNGGISLSMFIKFRINDIEEDIFGKFENIGTQRIPDFQCAEISKFSKENKIKIKGRLWNTIKDWLKIKPGIYNIIANEVQVYTETGQLIKLYKDNKIEVISSNEEIIKLTFNNITYIIKKPTYYWFNWQFEKI